MSKRRFEQIDPHTATTIIPDLEYMRTRLQQGEVTEVAKELFELLIDCRLSVRAYDEVMDKQAKKEERAYFANLSKQRMQP